MQTVRSLSTPLLAWLVLTACGATPALVEHGGGDGLEPPAPVCGNGRLEAGEACDGAAFGGASCATLGFDAGALACDASCGFDVSGCTRAERCGNGLDDDGDQLVDCFDPDCAGADHCPVCGDGVREGHEACDGADLGEESCASFGFDGGELACTARCSFDTTACFRLEVCDDGVDDDGDGAVDCDDSDCAGKPPCPYCGDGVINTADEACDRTAVPASCADFGMPHGVVRCTADCRLDPSTCFGHEICNVPGDEDQNGRADCEDPACAAVCTRCGNGVVDDAEECDGYVPSTITCRNGGFVDGTVRCSSSCMFDFSGCRAAVCGDGVPEWPERCDDGNLDGGDGCSPLCQIEGDVCETPLPLDWDAARSRWVLEGRLDAFERNYAASCAVTFTRPDAVATFVAPEAGRYFATVASSADTVLHALPPQCTTFDRSIQCSNRGPHGTTETIELDLAQGERVSLVVGLASDLVGEGAFRLEVGRSICGDGDFQGHEECDDGNLDAGDGCSAACRWEGRSCEEPRHLHAQPGVFEGAHPLGRHWTDAWVWADDTTIYGSDYNPAGCPHITPAADAVARFVAPFAGTWRFDVHATFDAMLYARNASCSPTPELGCDWTSGRPPAGRAAHQARLDRVLAAGEAIHLVVDGSASNQSGAFWLVASPPATCGDGVVGHDEECDDGDLADGDGCSAACTFEARESEFNGGKEWANPLLVGRPVFGSMTSASDSDFFRFEGTAGTRYVIATSNDPAMGGGCADWMPDTLLRLYDAAGTLLAENDDRAADDPCSRIQFIAPEDGAWFVEVRLASSTPRTRGGIPVERQETYLLHLDVLP